MWPSEKIASFIYNWANIVLIFSLIFGVISTSLVVWMGNIKEEYLRRELANSHERTASLERQSVDAKIAIANAEKEAAEAKLALEKFKAPRFLSQKEQELIVSRIKIFSGQEYKVTTFWDMKEPLDFSNQIHRVLQSAGWIYVLPGEGGSFLLGGLDVIQVFVHPEANDTTKKATDILASTLNEIGYVSKLMKSGGAKNNSISINVGTKR